jgi:hypothetical protein
MLLHEVAFFWVIVLRCIDRLVPCVTSLVQIEEGTIEPHMVVPNPAPSTDGRHHQTAIHERKGAAKSQPQHQNSSQVILFLSI